MITWIQEHPADFAVIILLVVAVFLAILLIRKDRRAGRSSCGGNCASCAMRGACGSPGKDRTDS